MKYLIKITLVLILISTYGAISKAKAEELSKEPERHVLLQQLIDKKNLTVYYLGKSYGLDGWVLKDENKKDKENGAIQYVYTTPEGGMILGLLFGSDGSIETIKQIRTMQGKQKEGKEILTGKTPTAIDAPTATPSIALQNYRKAKAKMAENQKKPEEKVIKKTEQGTKDAKNKNSKSEKFYSSAENSNWVSIGSNKAPYIYVFANPACSHCKDYWKDLTPSIKNGTVQVRLIPFGRVEINRNAGAALLSVSNPATAWNTYVDGDKSALDVKLATTESFKKLDSNTEIWAKWQLPMPPFTVYRSPQDGKVKVIAGKPDNTLLLLSELMQ